MFSIAHMGHIRTGRVCGRTISSGVVAWPNLSIVEVVPASFFLVVDKKRFREY